MLISYLIKRFWLLFIFCFYINSSYSVLAMEGGTFGLNLGMFFPNKSSGIDFKNGNLASVGFGLKSGTIRYELELKGMMNDIKTPGGDVITIGGLYNMYYDFEGLGIDLVPYIGGGAGITYVRSKVEGANDDDPTSKGNNYPLAFQVKAGASYLMSEMFSWVLGYQYFRTLVVKNLGDDNFASHQIFLGALWYIG